jgi:hypothetical protein
VVSEKSAGAGASGGKKSSGKSIAQSSGKNAAPVVAKVVANRAVEGTFATTQEDDDFEIDGQVEGGLKGWRVEKNSNGRYRYRWQLKDAHGNPITYITSSGSVGYRRGSKYLVNSNAKQELKSNGKKRKKR